MGSAERLLLAAAFLALAACGGEDTREEDRRADWSAGVTASVDSGNAAYRAGDYREARRHFRAAVAEDPEVATAWFGVYMAEAALGNVAAADSALERVGELGETARLHHLAPGREDPHGEPGLRHQDPGGGGRP